MPMIIGWECHLVSSSSVSPPYLVSGENLSGSIVADRDFGYSAAVVKCEKSITHASTAITRHADAAGLLMSMVSAKVTA